MYGGFRFGPGYTSLESSTSQHAATSAKAAARDAAREARDLKGEIERLLMITEALWLFMKEEHGYTDEALIKKIAEIDIRDGKLDGKVARTQGEIETCPECGRKVGRRRQTCLFCGAPLVTGPFER